MSIEFRAFCTGAWQKETNECVKVEIPSGDLFIKFTLYKRTGSRRFDTLGGTTYDDPPTVPVNKALVIDPSHFLSNRCAYTKSLLEFISSSMPDVPEDEHPDIIEKTFKVVKGAVLGLPIEIAIVDTTVRLWGCARSVEEYHMILDSVTRELMDISKRIAATKLSIDGLEEVTLDSLDLTARQTTCVICKEGLDRVNVVEERIDHPLLITRLPCSHLYHGDCIAGWLQLSHLCPLCRYPMPIVKVAYELPSLQVTGDGPVGEVAGQGPIGEVTGEPQTVEVAGQGLIGEVTGEPQAMAGEGLIGEVTGEPQAVEMAGEGPIVEVTDDQPIVEVADEQPIFEVADEPSKTSREVDWPMLLKMSAGGIITAMLLYRLLRN